MIQKLKIIPYQYILYFSYCLFMNNLFTDVRFKEKIVRRLCKMQQVLLSYKTAKLILDFDEDIGVEIFFFWHLKLEDNLPMRNVILFYRQLQQCFNQA